MDTPRASTHYPKFLGEFQAWFQTDADCLDYLEWLRWPSGFVCPACAQAGGWRLGDGRVMCAGCGARTSVTVGTIFDRTRTPLTEKGLGRCRMQPIPDASAATLHPFVMDHVELGATLVTDAWQSYAGLKDKGYRHDRRSQRAAEA